MNPAANKTALVTGNSFAWFQIRGILDALKQSKQEFSKVYLVSHMGCSLLVGEFNQGIKAYGCQKMNGSHDEFLKVVKPDIHIHTSRFESPL